MPFITKLKLFLGTSEAYKSIFKAGFVLVASATIALGQVGPELYSKDLEAHKLAFEAEYAMQTAINKNTDCSEAGVNTVVCRLAVHHMKSLDATLSLWEAFIRFAGGVGGVLMVVGFIGFFMPLFGRPS